MQQLGESFVKSVLDVRRRNDEECKTAAFQGKVTGIPSANSGWQSEDWKRRKAQMLQMNDIGLRGALERAAGTDIFIIPREHFAGETLEQRGEGWWYKVRSVIWCRECRRCGVRKESSGFAQKEWNKKQPPMCVQCVFVTE